MLEDDEKHQSKKRQSSKIDKMFDYLFDDLNLLYIWEQDEKTRKAPTDILGYLWIARGVTAIRLQRKRLAERALRNGLQ